MRARNANSQEVALPHPLQTNQLETNHPNIKMGLTMELEFQSPVHFSSKHTHGIKMMLSTMHKSLSQMGQLKRTSPLLSIYIRFLQQW